MGGSWGLEQHILEWRDIGWMIKLDSGTRQEVIDQNQVKFTGSRAGPLAKVNSAESQAIVKNLQVFFCLFFAKCEGK